MFAGTTATISLPLTSLISQENAIKSVRVSALNLEGPEFSTSLLGSNFRRLIYLDVFSVVIYCYLNFVAKFGYYIS